MAILTPYLNQEIYIKDLFNEIPIIKSNIMTIDKSQGMEREIIIISFSTIIKDDFLANLERLNVAFTRAKSKLICIGDFKVLSKIEYLKEFLNIFESMDSDSNNDIVNSDFNFNNNNNNCNFFNKNLKSIVNVLDFFDYITEKSINENN